MLSPISSQCCIKGGGAQEKSTVYVSCHLSVEIYILHLQGHGDSWGARLQMLSHPLGSRWVPCRNSRPGGFWTIWISFPCQRWQYFKRKGKGVLKNSCPGPGGTCSVTWNRGDPSLSRWVWTGERGGLGTLQHTYRVSFLTGAPLKITSFFR